MVPDPVAGQVERLLAKIVTLGSNPHYRMGDVIYRKGVRFLDSAEKVLTLPEFEGTILRDYLLRVGDPEIPDIPLLAGLVEEAIASGRFRVAGPDELVVHLRAGDVVDRAWFLQGDVARKIGRFSHLRRCRLVICFAFGEFPAMDKYMFSEEKLARNVAMTRDLLASLVARYRDMTFDVESNTDVDRDFVLMASARHFIRDRGGFSQLICDIHDHRARMGR